HSPHSGLRPRGPPRSRVNRTAKPRNLLAVGPARRPSLINVSGPISLIATGDAIINRRVSVLDDQDFHELRDLIAGAGAALTNFETPTPRPPIVPAPSHGLQISSPSFVIDELSWMGFGLFNLANNHAVAFGWQGAADTLAAFESRGLAVAGSGHTLTE